MSEQLLFILFLAQQLGFALALVVIVWWGTQVLATLRAIRGLLTEEDEEDEEDEADADICP